MLWKRLSAAAAASPFLLLAYQNGAPIKNTGNVDGGQDCTTCHRTFAPANSDPRGSIVIQNLQPYVPGVSQNLRVLISHPLASAWGFQLTARFVTGGGALKAGSFTPSNSLTQVVCDDGSLRGSPGPCLANQFEWIEHASAPRTQAGQQSYGFEFQWTPPPQENGDIVFYLAGAAADGDSQPTNDRIYTTTIRIPLSSDAACPLTQRPQIRNAVNAGAHAGPFGSNTMVEIYGANFQPTSRTRAVGAGDLSNNAFPQALACIAVEVGGARAPVTYVQQDQINIQAPTLTASGPVNLVVIGNPGKPNELRSDPATVTLQQPSPSFFTLGSTKSIAAQFANTADVAADPSVVPGARPAKPGDYLTLYGTGFGATKPAWQSGQISTTAAPLTDAITVSIGGTVLSPADILYAGLSPQSISGLYQINVRVPLSTPDGDIPVIATIDGVSTQADATIPVKH